MVPTLRGGRRRRGGNSHVEQAGGFEDAPEQRRVLFPIVVAESVHDEDFDFGAVGLLPSPRLGTGDCDDAGQKGRENETFHIQ